MHNALKNATFPRVLMHNELKNATISRVSHTWKEKARAQRIGLFGPENPRTTHVLPRHEKDERT